MNRFLKNLLSVLLPDRCPYCNRVVDIGATACPTCIKLISKDAFRNYAKGGYPCYSPFFYKGIYSTAIKRFKFHGYSQYAEKLAVPLTNAIISLEKEVKFDLITCVPMHPKKEKRRGYNQSKLLAKEAAKLLGKEYADLIIKVKDNKEQHKCKTAAQRRDNVKGVYQAINKDKIKGKNILIIDDILTTGYTLGECCRVLERSKADKIRCATVCAKNDM